MQDGRRPDATRQVRAFQAVDVLSARGILPATSRVQRGAAWGALQRGETRMSRATAAVLALGLVAASPAAGWASGLELRIGGFFPRGQSDLFADVNELYSPVGELRGVKPNDFDGVYGGAEYSFNVAERVEMGISLDGYSNSNSTVYRDFTRPDGSEIHQELKLSVVPLGLSLRFLPLDRRAPIQPYVTIGADAIFYQYEEFGDFIDFFSNNLDISSDSFESD